MQAGRQHSQIITPNQSKEVFHQRVRTGTYRRRQLPRVRTVTHVYEPRNLELHVLLHVCLPTVHVHVPVTRPAELRALLQHHMGILHVHVAS